MKGMILIHSALSDDTRAVVISVETDLTNMDLKSISARSLPCPHTLLKSSHLLSPKVLQESDGNAPLHSRSCKLGQLKVGFLSGITLTLAPRVVGYCQKSRGVHFACMGKEKGWAKPSIGGACTSSCREEELARQLQNQFDLDDYHVQKGPHDVDAENIKMSMLSCQKEDDRDYEGRVRGGRGQGRSRGRGRGRGRGRFR